MSYQNGGGPRKIEEIGVTPEELRQKKKVRRSLFVGLGVLFVVIFIMMAALIHQHQQESHFFGFDYGIQEDSSGTASTTSFDPSMIPLERLNKRTNSSTPSGCETTIVLIRHCEKIGEETTDEDGNEHCSYVGYERAQFIPSLFGSPSELLTDNTNSIRWPVPSALFALRSRRSDHYNFREIETLVPLADKYGLKIESNFHHNNAMAKRLYQGLETSDWCGKVIVVSWKHELLGDLAKLMGCTDCPDMYPMDSFDEVWQLKYVYDVHGTNVIQGNNMYPDKATTAKVDNDSNARRRNLKKTGRKKMTSKAPIKTWSVYSAITAQNFDPLKFSFHSGDYSGGNIGGNWQSSSVDNHSGAGGIINDGEM